MKRCPKCNRTFSTETQKFCTHDGAPLVTAESGHGRNSARVPAAPTIPRPLPTPERAPTRPRTPDGALVTRPAPADSPLSARRHPAAPTDFFFGAAAARPLPGAFNLVAETAGAAE